MHDIDELSDPARIDKEEFKKNINFYVRAKSILQKKFLIKIFYLRRIQI